MNVRTLKTLSVTAVASGLLLGGIRTSQAQQFTFTTTNNAASVGTAPNGGMTITSPTTAPIYGSAGATGASFLDTPGSNSVPITVPSNVRVFTVTPSATGGATTFNDTFDLTINLTSNAVTVPFKFVGLTLTGTLDSTSGAVSDNVFFTTPSNHITQNVGGNSFTVFLNGNTPPGTFGSPTPDGTLGARIEAVPEPGSIALMVGMGVSGSAFFLRRRKIAK